MTNESTRPGANPSVAQAERPHFSRRVFKLEELLEGRAIDPFVATPTRGR
jgi:hypothetical protein